jgi:predicted ATPase/DNA-binding SARP family transcriptional activator
MHEGPRTKASGHPGPPFRVQCFLEVHWAAGNLGRTVAGGVSRFGVLGALVFERDGRSVPLPSGRQRSLLALLLLAGGVPLSRDRLIDELWGERPPASAVSALHVHLSKLRGLLGDLLVLEAAGYALQAGAFELDVWRFDALVEQARTEPERTVALLSEALGLFRGEPLSDVACEGSIAQWRRALEEKRMQAILLRIDAELAAGAAGELVAELERLASEHPFEERLWGQLMLALYRAGRQADALEAYQRARRLFAAELGLEPGDQLGGLQQRILDRDPTLNPAAPEAAPPPVPVEPTPEEPPARPPSTLPRPLTRLVGRQWELEMLAAMLADPDIRLITLTGPGGVGKTRLLLELARLQEPNYLDGAVLVRLERLTDPALVAAEIASALALRADGDGPGADGLSAYLRERELLLVIDNFEHLPAAAMLIAELLAVAPSIRVLVSSRTALRIRGEQVCEVEPLPLPASDSASEARESPAVQLFLQSALAANRKLEIDAAVTETVARICRALDGLPLAIELAASRARWLSPAQIADQLARPLNIGGQGLRDLPDRQQTLQATMRWSYDLLAVGAQEVLRCAGVFLGGFTLAALEAAVGRPIHAEIDELLEASLVRRQADVGRFELLELVRAFALEELEACGQASEARARHRGYFATFVAATTQAFDQGGAPADLAAPLVADHANVRSALENAIEAGDEASALDLALGLRPVWLAGMLRQESQEFAQRLLDSFSIPGPSEVALLRAVAFLDYSAGAAVWHQRLVTRAREIGDQETLAMATGNLFGRALNARDLEEMRRLRPALLDLANSESSPKALGWVHYFLALDDYVDERFDASCEHASRSAEKAEEIGHEFMLGSAMGTRLLAASARDGVMEQPALAETLEFMRRPGVPPLAAFALWLVARYAAGVAPDTAGRWLAHAERILAELNSPLWPESALRDETMEVLGLDDLTPVLASTPILEHAAALAEAAAWLAERGVDEKAPRDSPRRLTAHA